MCYTSGLCVAKEMCQGLPSRVAWHVVLRTTRMSSCSVHMYSVMHMDSGSITHRLTLAVTTHDRVMWQ